MKNNGQSLIELLIAMTILVLAVSANSFLILDAYLSNRQGKEIVQATYLSEEGLEAARSIRNNNWQDLSPGVFGLRIVDSKWSFFGSEEILDLLKNGKRKIIIEDIGANRKKITSKVLWQLTEARPQEVSLTAYFTNWSSPSGITSGGGEIEGEGALSGDWANPLTLSSIDLGPGSSGTDIDIQGNFIYLTSVASDIKKDDFFVFDITDTKNPVLSAKLDTGKGLNSLSVKGDFVYVVGQDSDKEFQIVNIKNSKNPFVQSQVNLPGLAEGLAAVFSSGDYVFLGTKESKSDKEFYLADVSNPSQPKIVSSVEISGDVFDIYTFENFAYLATGVSSKELIIVDISNPNLPILKASYDILTEKGAISVFVKSQELVYLGTANKLFILDTKELDKISIRGSIATGGQVNDIAAAKNLIFLATAEPNKEFQVLNAIDPTKPYLYSYFNYPQVATGCDYANNLVLTSVRSNDAFRTITSQ